MSLETRLEEKTHIPDLFDKINDFDDVQNDFFDAARDYHIDPFDRDTGKLLLDSIDDVRYCFRGVARAILLEKRSDVEDRTKGMATFYMEADGRRIAFLQSLMPHDEKIAGTRHGAKWLARTMLGITLGNGPKGAIGFVTSHMNKDLQEEVGEFASFCQARILEPKSK